MATKLRKLTQQESDEILNLRDPNAFLLAQGSNAAPLPDFSRVPAHEVQRMNALREAGTTALWDRGFSPGDVEAINANIRARQAKEKAGVTQPLEEAPDIAKIVEGGKTTYTNVGKEIESARERLAPKPAPTSAVATGPGAYNNAAKLRAVENAIAAPAVSPNAVNEAAGLRRRENEWASLGDQVSRGMANNAFNQPNYGYQATLRGMENGMGLPQLPSVPMPQTTPMAPLPQVQSPSSAPQPRLPLRSPILEPEMPAPRNAWLDAGSNDIKGDKFLSPIPTAASSPMPLKRPLRQPFARTPAPAAPPTLREGWFDSGSNDQLTGHMGKSYRPNVLGFADSGVVPPQDEALQRMQRANDTLNGYLEENAGSRIDSSAQPQLKTYDPFSYDPAQNAMRSAMIDAGAAGSSRADKFNALSTIEALKPQFGLDTNLTGTNVTFGGPASAQFNPAFMAASGRRGRRMFGFARSGVHGDVSKDAGNDTQPAMVRPGEYMVDPDAVAEVFGGGSHAKGVRNLNHMIESTMGYKPGAKSANGMQGFMQSGAAREFFGEEPPDRVYKQTRPMTPEEAAAFEASDEGRRTKGMHNQHRASERGINIGSKAGPYNPLEGVSAPKEVASSLRNLSKYGLTKGNALTTAAFTIPDIVGAWNRDDMTADDKVAETLGIGGRALAGLVGGGVGGFGGSFAGPGIGTLAGTVIGGGAGYTLADKFLPELPSDRLARTRGENPQKNVQPAQPAQPSQAAQATVEAPAPKQLSLMNASTPEEWAQLKAITSRNFAQPTGPGTYTTTDVFRQLENMKRLNGTYEDQYERDFRKLGQQAARDKYAIAAFGRANQAAVDKAVMQHLYQNQTLSLKDQLELRQKQADFEQKKFQDKRDSFNAGVKANQDRLKALIPNDATRAEFMSESYRYIKRRADEAQAILNSKESTAGQKAQAKADLKMLLNDQGGLHTADTIGDPSFTNELFDRWDQGRKMKEHASIENPWAVPLATATGVLGLGAGFAGAIHAARKGDFKRIPQVFKEAKGLRGVLAGARATASEASSPALNFALGGGAGLAGGFAVHENFRNTGVKPGLDAFGNNMVGYDKKTKEIVFENGMRMPAKQLMVQDPSKFRQRIYTRPEEQSPWAPQIQKLMKAAGEDV